MKSFWAILILFSLIAAAIAWGELADRENGAARTAQSQARDDASIEQLIQQAVAIETEAMREKLRREMEAELAALRTAEDEQRKAVPQNEAATADAERELVEDLLAGDMEMISIPPPDPGSANLDHKHIDQPQRIENPWETRQEPLAHSIVKRDDGSILLDDTFEIRGDGTAASPYEITWDLLMSAAETYQPRLGMSDIPERVQMLNGKHVRISGYLMFPTAAFEAKELLVMLNMWDGCCLGTMPSPYDAIEVDLAEPVSGTRRQFMNYGTLEGVLQIDPYLINDWLIGLYMLEEATLKVGL